MAVAVLAGALLPLGGPGTAAGVPPSSAPCVPAELAFTPTAHGPSGVEPRSLVVRDLDADGTPEVVVANSDSNNVTVYRRGTDGAYAPTVVGGTGIWPLSVAAGDVNGDGLVDIVTANYDSESVTLLTQGASGTFTPTTIGGTGAGPFGIAVGDLDGDSDNDVVVTDSVDDAVTVLTQGSNGSFSRTSHGTGGDSPTWVAVADLDGAGGPEIVTTDINSDEISILTRGEGGAYAAVTADSTGNSPRGLRVVDIDGDGVLEIVVANFASATVDVFERGTGGGYTATEIGEVGAGATDITPADYDGDGDLDIATAGSTSNDATVLVQADDGTFAPVTLSTAGRSLHAMTGGDLDGDGDADLAGVDRTTGNLVVLTNGTVPSECDPGDTTAPTTTDDVPGGVVTSPVTVTLTATDNEGGSGVEEIAYTIGSAVSPPGDPRGPFGTLYNETDRPVLFDGQIIRYAATDADGNTETPKSSAAAQVTATVTAPVVTGSPQVGRTLRAGVSSTPDDAAVTYQWWRQLPGGEPTPIEGAVDATYRVVSADVRRRLSVVASAARAGYRTASATSPPTAVVSFPPIGPFGVSVVGSDRVFGTRIARTSLDDDRSVRLRYQWQMAVGRRWVDVGGSDSSQRLELPPRAADRRVRVEVTAVRGESRRVVASAATLIQPNIHRAAHPRIEGRPAVGKRVVAGFDDADPARGRRVTFRWLIDGRVRSRAPSIVLPSGSAGRRVLLKILLTAPGYRDQELETSTIILRR